MFGNFLKANIIHISSIQWMTAVGNCKWNKPFGKNNFHGTRSLNWAHLRDSSTSNSWWSKCYTSHTGVHDGTPTLHFINFTLIFKVYLIKKSNLFSLYPFGLIYIFSSYISLPSEISSSTLSHSASSCFFLVFLATQKYIVGKSFWKEEWC